MRRDEQQMITAVSHRKSPKQICAITYHRRRTSSVGRRAEFQLRHLRHAKTRDRSFRTRSEDERAKWSELFRECANGLRGEVCNRRQLRVDRCAENSDGKCPVVTRILSFRFA